MKAILDFIVAQAGLDDISQMGEGACKMVEEMLTNCLAQAFCNIGEPARCLVQGVRFEGSGVVSEVAALELQGVLVNLYGDQGWSSIVEKWSSRYHKNEAFTLKDVCRVADPDLAAPDAVDYLTEKLKQVKALAHAQHIDGETPQAPSQSSRPRL